MDKLKSVIRTLETLNAEFVSAQERVATMGKPWNFDGRSMFKRLSTFEQRVKNIMELFDTIIEFNRLEKIEIGGTKVNYLK